MLFIRSLLFKVVHMCCGCAVEDGCKFSQGIFKFILVHGLADNKFTAAELGNVQYISCLYILSEKNKQNWFCQNFIKLSSNLTIFLQRWQRRR